MSAVSWIFGGSALSAGDHLVSIGLPKAYGYVVLVAVASIFMLLWKGIKVLKLTLLAEIRARLQS
jgi:hypothetical protein